MIAATGVLHHPFTPDIAGLDTFGGDVVHTARWDDDIVTEGRRIAVIGTGSTGVQIVSALQRRAGHISHFVRTPQWVMWAPMGLSQPAVFGAALRRLPDRQREALVLRFYLGVSEEETARAMGISRGTVKSSTSRALAALGRMLKEES